MADEDDVCLVPVTAFDEYDESEPPKAFMDPRHVVPNSAQTYEPEVPVEVREWIGPAPASPDLVLGTQPPAQPHSGVTVERTLSALPGSRSQ
jgi:hypothetical protein